MAVVNTNVNASVAQNALTRNERSMNATMERLSTGQRSAVRLTGGEFRPE